MNELNTRLLEYLPDPNTVKGGIGSVVESLQVEAPVLVSEILRWEATESACWCCLGVSFLVAVFVATVNAHKYNKPCKEYKEYAAPLYIFMTAIPSALAIAVVLTDLQWLQIWIAPRLFLLEYVRDLMK